MNEKEEALATWLGHVNRNKEKLKYTIEKLSTPSGLLEDRNLLAEHGVEVTPQELKEFVALVKASLDILED